MSSSVILRRASMCATVVFPLAASAAAPYYEKHADRLPISLQDHGDLVRFRNIWVRRLV